MYFNFELKDDVESLYDLYKNVLKINKTENDSSKIRQHKTRNELNLKIC